MEEILSLHAESGPMNSKNEVANTVAPIPTAMKRFASRILFWSILPVTQAHAISLADLSSEERQWLAAHPHIQLEQSNVPVITLSLLLFLCVIVIAIMLRKLRRNQQPDVQETATPASSEQNSTSPITNQNIFHIGNWTWDVKNHDMVWSRETFTILRQDPSRHKASADNLIRSIHPDDRKSMSAILDDVLYGKGLKYTQELRLLDEGSKPRYAKLHCRLQRDSAGKPQTLSGVIQDITEQKTIELALREKQQTLQSLLDNAPIGIWFQNTTGKLLFVNQAFCGAIGINEEDFLSVPHYSVLYSPETAKSCMASDEIALCNEGPQVSYERMRFVDGKYHDLEIIKSRVHDENGKSLGLIGLSMDITDKKQAEEKLLHQAFFDEVTGLGNRNYLMENLAKSLANSARHNHFNALLFFDLDNFKIINDSLGHHTGDILLKEIGNRLKEVVRAEDTVARLGGDEFIVILNDLGKEQRLADAQAHDIAEKIRKKLALPYDLGEQEQHITMSVGISMFPNHDNDVHDILKHADIAMYRAKEAGRNTVRFFIPSMQKEAEERLLMQNMLRYALPNKQFMLHFQPQFNHQGEMIGAESLLRWQHPSQGLIPPSRFIPVAEESGQIIDIGAWVLRETCVALKRWQDLGNSHITLSANVSPRQFHQANFVEQVLSVVTETGVDPNYLELELTESLLIEHLGDVTEKMNRLKQHGIRFAIDDFGTGYSSLVYLKRLPLDRLKIDQSFIRDLTTDPSDALIVETIIAMATHLELEVIAEGVETEEQLQFLQKRGCAMHQGYYFSRPLPQELFEKFLTSGSSHRHNIK
jgi:diguanylate cyclase (GGDEF)-like protein/PAS domain S-box-containing protein